MQNVFLGIEIVQRPRKPTSSPTVDIDDRNLFRQAVRGTRALRGAAALPETPQVRLEDSGGDAQARVSDAKNTPQTALKQGIVSVDGDLFYRAGVQRKTLLTLKRGRVPRSDVIDLHGHDRRTAVQHLSEFITHSASQRFRSVLVITGKGRSSPGGESVIRSETRHWLQKQACVLAYCPAQPGDGGSGAFYVLLDVRS